MYHPPIFFDPQFTMGVMAGWLLQAAGVGTHRVPGAHRARARHVPGRDRLAVRRLLPDRHPQLVRQSRTFRISTSGVKGFCSQAFQPASPSMRRSSLSG